MPTQLVAPMMNIVRKILGGKSAAMVIKRKNVGIDNMTSNKREMTKSVHEPKYPAMAPSTTPIMTAIPTATKPIDSETREP